MTETVVAALIGGGISLLVCVITNIAQSSKTRALLEYKLDELTKRVDKHNNVIERTFQLEKTTDVQTEQIKVINHRIEDLEKGGSGK